MARQQDRFSITIRLGGKRLVAKAPLKSIRRLVLIFNRQFTNSPNTTQIASGAGHSGAAGSNAAIRSPRTWQQQSVGADGTARNAGAGGKAASRRMRALAADRKRLLRRGKEVVVVINEQIAKLPRGQNASATQVASGAGVYGAGGTNTAISSPGTRQQHAVGGGGTAVNKLRRSRKRRKR